MSSSTDHEVIVLGGGIVGLATAYRLLNQEPSLSATVLERAPAVGTGQSSRNSGVVLAGTPAGQLIERMGHPHHSIGTLWIGRS